MIYRKIPDHFEPRFEVVSCFIEHDGEFLLLHRNENKSEGNKWGVPGGKIEQGESREAALVREIEEEIGSILSPEDVEHFDTVYVRYPEYDFFYHMFHAQLKQKPQIILNAKEHKNFRWATPFQALKLPLVQDEDTCVRLFYGNTPELLIAQAVAHAGTLDEVYVAIVGVFRHLREDFGHSSLGYASGAVTSD